MAIYHGYVWRSVFVLERRLVTKIQGLTVLKIKKSSLGGYGVFATRHIKAGTIVERAHCIAFSLESWHHLKQFDFPGNYAFHWGGEGTDCEPCMVIATGYGSIFNHSYSPNVRYEDHPEFKKHFIALVDIPRGCELTINYNGDHKDPTPIWFDTKE